MTPEPMTAELALALLRHALLTHVPIEALAHVLDRAIAENA
jgi:hypothetical protein